MAFAVSLSQPAYAGQVTPPPVPPNIQVPAGNKAFLVGHAFGTQNYVCKPSASSASGVAYVLFTPEATLFSDDGGQVITHFFSPNPDPLDPNTSSAVVADGAIRATWQHRGHEHGLGQGALQPRWIQWIGHRRPKSIAWLLLEVVGAETDPPVATR